jgi:hypothetical protein
VVNGWRRSGVVLAVATELHESVNANLAGAGLLVANVVDAGLAMEKLLLVDATSDALDESLLDARRATVVHILVIATQGREDEFLQELIRKVIEILGPVGGNELIGPLGAGDVLIGVRAGAKRVRGAGRPSQGGRLSIHTVLTLSWSRLNIGGIGEYLTLLSVHFFAALAEAITMAITRRRSFICEAGARRRGLGRVSVRVCERDGKGSRRGSKNIT